MLVKVEALNFTLHLLDICEVYKTNNSRERCMPKFLVILNLKPSVNVENILLQNSVKQVLDEMCTF